MTNAREKLIEAMARAIASAAGIPPEKECKDGKVGWQICVSEAEAAIETIEAAGGWLPEARRQFIHDTLHRTFSEMVAATGEQEVKPDDFREQLETALMFVSPQKKEPQE